MKKNKTMKRLFFLLLLGLALGYGCRKINTPPTVINHKMIPNYDFENWPPGGLIWFLPGWTTNNTTAISSTEVDPDSLNVYHGHYAAKLLNDYTYPALAETKFPITVHPLSLRAYVKCDLAPSDTVSIGIKLFYKGRETDSGVWYGTKSIDNYKQINIPISQISALADSALIEIRGGDHIMNNQQFGKGSVFWVDYLSFLLKK